VTALAPRMQEKQIPLAQLGMPESAGPPVRPRAEAKSGGRGLLLFLVDLSQSWKLSDMSSCRN
jgi:hypothetical protein